jgi:hypothetical protein
MEKTNSGDVPVVAVSEAVQREGEQPVSVVIQEPSIDEILQQIAESRVEMDMKINQMSIDKSLIENEEYPLAPTLYGGGERGGVWCAYCVSALFSLLLFSLILAKIATQRRYTFTNEQQRVRQLNAYCSYFGFKYSRSR